MLSNIKAYQSETASQRSPSQNSRSCENHNQGSSRKVNFKDPHTFTGRTGCGKSYLVLDLICLMLDFSKQKTSYINGLRSCHYYYHAHKHSSSIS